jgi:Holliday junction resolvase RusA-like endonuclease
VEAAKAEIRAAAGHEPNATEEAKRIGYVKTVSFTVPALPVAQPRQQHAARTAKDGRTFVHSYTPRDSAVSAFKATVRMAAREIWDGPPMEGCIEVWLTFVFKRPSNMLWKRRPMPRVRRPKGSDTDNLVKSFQDALNGLLWIDDRQITDLHACKRIAAGDETACVEAVVSEVPSSVEEDLF